MVDVIVAAMKSPDSESANGAVIAHFNPIKVTHLRSYIATHHSEISQQYAVSVCIVPSCSVSIFDI